MKFKVTVFFVGFDLICTVIILVTLHVNKQTMKALLPRKDMVMMITISL